jgi:hypothetical protein
MRTMFTAAASAALAAILAWSGPVMAQPKTVKQCRVEWNAGRDAIKASGKTQKAFIAECRGVPATPRTARLAGALVEGQYPTEAEAKAGCPGDRIVWVNLRSGISHEPGSRGYGATRAGTYMCEKASAAAGFRAAKSARDPARDLSTDSAKPASS